jgi:hypothetical protein
MVVAEPEESDVTDHALAIGATGVVRSYGGTRAVELRTGPAPRRRVRVGGPNGAEKTLCQRE